MTLSFWPVATQMYCPGVALQLTVLPAAVRAGDAVTVTALKLVDGYENVHSKPAIWLLPASLKVSPRATVEPGTTEPDERDRVVCPQLTPPTSTTRPSLNNRTHAQIIVGFDSIFDVFPGYQTTPFSTSCARIAHGSLIFTKKRVPVPIFSASVVKSDNSPARFALQIADHAATWYLVPSHSRISLVISIRSGSLAVS
jgi:hypothetical protein